RPRLVQHRDPAVLALEVDVRAARPLNVDERREGRLLERRARVVDAKTARAVGDRRTERVVLEPIDVERADRRPGDRDVRVAGLDAAADHPDAEAGVDHAPEAVGKAVRPVGDETVSPPPPFRLERRDREGDRLGCVLGRLAPGDGPAAHVHLARAALVGPGLPAALATEANVGGLESQRSGNPRTAAAIPWLRNPRGSGNV